MAKPDQQKLFETVQPHLEPGEQIRHCGIAYRKPTMWLIIPLVALAVLPGLIAMQLLTKYFLIALTNRRLLILRYKGKFQIQEVREFRLGQIPPVETATGPVHTNLTLRGGAEKFFCQFHRSLAKENRTHALAIVEALQNPGSPGALPVTPATAQTMVPRVTPPPLPVASVAATTGAFALRLGARRFALQPDTLLREDDIAGLLSKADDGVVATVDRNPNNPAILGLKNLSTSAWSITLPDGEKKELDAGRSIKLAGGTRIGFGFCDGVIEM